jgi:hypothetical protein
MRDRERGGRRLRDSTLTYNGHRGAAAPAAGEGEPLLEPGRQLVVLRRRPRPASGRADRPERGAEMEAELGGTGGTNDSAPRPLGFAERTETYRIADDGTGLEDREERSRTSRARWPARSPKGGQRVRRDDRRARRDAARTLCLTGSPNENARVSPAFHRCRRSGLPCSGRGGWTRRNRKSLLVLESPRCGRSQGAAKTQCRVAPAQGGPPCRSTHRT